MKTYLITNVSTDKKLKLSATYFEVKNNDIILINAEKDNTSLINEEYLIGVFNTKNYTIVDVNLTKILE